MGVVARIDRLVQAQELDRFQRDAGLLAHLAARGLLEPLAELDAPAGQAPSAGPGRVTPAHETDLARTQQADGNTEKGATGAHGPQLDRTMPPPQALPRGSGSTILAAMCGRFALTASPQAVAAAFDLVSVDPFPPRFNIAPTQPVLHVALHPARGGIRREASLARWG